MMRKTLRKALFLLLLSPLACVLRAENGGVAGGWGGLHDSDTSMGIGDNEAQDLLNVDITDSGFGVKKRSGFSSFRTIGTSTWPVRSGYYWRDAGGNDELVYANNRSIFKSVNSGAFSAFVTTDTAGSYYDFTDSNGWLYRATSNHDQILRYNGTSVEYSTAPKGSIIEMLSDRLLIAGTTDYPNRLYYSARADFTDFTTGLLESSAFTYDHGLPGQSITAVKAWNNGVLVWTKSTLSYVVYDSQNDLTPVSKISGTIGTLQPYTVIDDYGVVYFQAQDKHWYMFDGNGLQRISSPVDVNGIVSGSNKNWVVSTQTDFGEGFFQAGLSSTTAPDDIVYGMEIRQDAHDMSTSFPFQSRTFAQSFKYAVAVPTVTASVYILSGGTPVSPFISTWTIRTDNANEPSSVILTTATLTMSIPMSGYYVLNFSPSFSLSANTTYWLYCNASASYGGLANRYYWEGSGNAYPDGQIWSDNMVSGYENQDFTFRVYSSTVVYQSPARYIGGAITGWGSIDVGNVLNGGSISYALYGDSDSSITITNPATFTSSQTITSGSIPTIAVAPYVTWAANFSRTVSTQTPTLNDVTINWYEGVPTTHYGSTDDNHRLIWAVAEGTATAPNVSYLYDQRFNAWLKYDVPFQAPVKVGDSLYFGGVSTGVVYNWPSGNTDNGAAITAYWKSKDFIGTDPYTEKDFFHYNIVAKSQTGSNLDFTYTVNTSTAISRNYSLTDSNGNSIKRINENMASGKYGTFFNFKFGNDDGDSPFEIYAVGYEYKPKPWRVLP